MNTFPRKGTDVTTPLQRLDSLTSLRAVAAFTVFGVHFCSMSSPNTPSVLARLMYQGGVGVSFFFVLSGFVLHWAFKQGMPARAFWRRRFARIYPAYLVAWLIGIGVEIYSGRMLHPFSALASLLLVQTWFPHGDYWFAVNGVGWTLCCEAFFYSLFPLLRRVTLFSRRARLILLVSCPLATLAFGLAGQTQTEHGLWISQFLPLVRLPEFLLGVLLADALRRGELRRVPLLPASVLSLVVYVLMGYVHWRNLFVALPLIPLSLVLVAAAQRDLTGTSPLTRRSFIWLGEISYSFYLAHELVRDIAVEAGSRILGHTWRLNGLVENVAVFIPLLGLSVLGAAGLHYVIERPAERRLRGDNVARSVPSESHQITGLA